jgi:dynein light chain roadblock-type
LISKSSAANPSSTLPASSDPSSDNFTNGRKESGIHSAEDVAGMVWSFLSAAGNLVDELDKEDEVRLLRLRTKKNELVIVPGAHATLAAVSLTADFDPDPKFILVVIHDTPPA